MNPQTRPDRPRLRAVLAGACAALFAVAPLAALADPPIAPATHTLESKVSLADLDLSTPEGVRAAHKRLRGKAEYLCRQLWEATLAEAIQQLNAPALAALDHGRSKP